MKTTTIGRIGAIVTGAAMLGTAVASALAGAVTVDSSLDKGFFYDDNMNPKVQVVVGEKAQASDGAAAGQIAAMIGNLAFDTTTVSQGGGNKTVSGGTATCTPDAAQCGAGNSSAEGSVTLSWAAIGKVGELEQREMDCNVYDNAMDMENLTDGGDSGSFCDDQAWEGADDFSEYYDATDTIGSTVITSCGTSTAQNSYFLRANVFANNICTICYNYCDLALGCEPHLMGESVVLNCDKMAIEYDCDDEELKLKITDGAIDYSVFTDDILTGDIEDDDGKLVGQSYLGKIILGQSEYMVEDLNEDSITIVCGDTGTATTSEAMEYIPPAPGSACDAANSGDVYSIKLVGAQEIEEKGVVDVTLEVTKPDGTTEQVNSGISGTPVVGDIKIKLQRGTASSNIITGENSFTADLIVWYVPSEYTFEDDESYDESGQNVDDLSDDNVINWELKFNGGYSVTVADLAPLSEGGLGLEENEQLLYGLPLPDSGDENEQWDGCYDEVQDSDNDTEIIRFLQFSLQNDLSSSDKELPEGQLIQLPFNDADEGGYLLSPLKFGYLGLDDEDFQPMSMQETTDIGVEITDVDVYNQTEDDFYSYRTGVVLTYTDEYGDEISARIDEGPFQDGDILLVGDTPMKVGNFDWNDDDDQWEIDYKLKTGDDWDEDWSTLVIGTSATANWTVDSQLMDLVNVTTDYRNTSTSVTPLGVRWYVDNTTDEEDEAQLYYDYANDGVAFNLTGHVDTETELKGDVDITAGPDAENDWVNITGATDSGAEDAVLIQLDDPYDASSPEAFVYLAEGDDSICSDECTKIAKGEDDGTIVSLSGATVTIDGSTDEEEPNDAFPDNEDEDETIDEVTLTVPKNEMRPTIFFGMEETQNSSQITITDANVGSEVTIGGVPVTVEEFGVTGSVSAGTVVGGEPVTVQCDPVTVSCDAVTVDSAVPAEIGYKLVVVEGSQTKDNLVLIGGPSVNGLTKDLTTVDELCSSAVVKLVGSKLLVAGCEAKDTAEAADALVSWLKANV